MTRESYAILCYAANALEAERPAFDPVTNFEHLAELVYSLVERLIWADGWLDPAESDMLDALLEEDRLQRGALVERLSKGPADDEILKQVPEFIRACRRYDRVNGTRLEPTAINALDSLGMGVLASDREITTQEFDALRDALAACHRYLETRPKLG
ncbi:hypothetical protein [Fimbriimonas ginsengisoli]|uniref:Co-chaperone DjlA N-terminal domain-containing protein n=1 Tax=Fimbriimonas ginsengisoli Gsoil 348 TaxID=661478 RepID=A0A068NKX3_FIMGI|nr:hypothetical protein [Fimbriimonas ginsengisoli]AIE84243.1 hypothetical protein OP10G_0875 [Fimbriimonas ginsengisoli Gsoil 348]